MLRIAALKAILFAKIANKKRYYTVITAILFLTVVALALLRTFRIYVNNTSLLLLPWQDFIFCIYSTKVTVVVGLIHILNIVIIKTFVFIAVLLGIYSKWFIVEHANQHLGLLPSGLQIQANAAKFWAPSMVLLIGDYGIRFTVQY